MIEMAVDSGASETVMPKTTLPFIETRSGAAHKSRVQHESADGGLLPNEGEKGFVGYDTDRRKRGVKVQLAGVTRPLMSVRRIVERGNSVVFPPQGAYV